MQLKQLNMAGSNRKKIIFPNPMVAIEGIICFTLSLGACIFFIVGVQLDFVPVNSKLGVQLIWGFLLGGVILSIILAAPRCYTFYYLDGKNVKIITPFKKSVTRQLCEYKYIYLGYYSQWGIPHYHVIYSTYRVQKSLLSQVNQIPSSQNILKIRVSRKKAIKLQMDEKIP